MESSTCRLLLALLFAAVTVTEAINYLALPRMGRSNYIAFPRLGRNYIAFPRMGRSGRSDAGDDAAQCCDGLKTTWSKTADGWTHRTDLCEKDCCPGLTPIFKHIDGGSSFITCANPTKRDAENVLGKLQGLLKN